MSNWEDKKTKIEIYYNDLINKYGNDPRSCDYGRPESQSKKFAIISELITAEHKTVLDVGCGLGDFAEYLQLNASHINYTGIDLSKEFIKRSQARFPDLEFKKMDLLTENPGNFDFVTANGIFYLLGNDALKIMRQIITRMFELSTKSVAFNSLSSWCEDQEVDEFYADPIETLKFCRTLTPWVSLRHDYHSRDFTIYMHKDQVG